MIHIDVRRKAFGASEILHNIKLSIAEQEVLALLGPSGIGKTTLLRIIAGLDNAYEGKIERPDHIAMVFQQPNLLPWRHALDNLTVLTGVSEEQAYSALEDVGLKGKAGLFPSQLSLGQQRRLSLARAFAANPQFLIMDEPYASLDDMRLQDMLDLTRMLIDKTGVATLFVTHSQREAEYLATRIVHLKGQPATIS